MLCSPPEEIEVRVEQQYARYAYRRRHRRHVEDACLYRIGYVGPPVSRPYLLVVTVSVLMKYRSRLAVLDLVAPILLSIAAVAEDGQGVGVAEKKVNLVADHHP